MSNNNCNDGEHISNVILCKGVHCLNLPMCFYQYPKTIETTFLGGNMHATIKQSCFSIFNTDHTLVVFMKLSDNLLLITLILQCCRWRTQV